MPPALEALARRGIQPKSIVDGGANVGDWTRFALRTFPGVSVLMIEPQTEHAEVLRAIVDSDPEHVHYAACLIGPPDVNEIDFVVLEDSDGKGSSVLAENSDVPRHVERHSVTTLDALLAEVGLAPPDLIKLDVQGYELEVLKGAEAALEHAEFVLLELSLWPYNDGAPLAAEVMLWMASHGFRGFEILATTRRPDGVMIQFDMLFVAEWSQQIADVTTTYGSR